MVFEAIKDILNTQLGFDTNKLSMTTNIITELGADSLDLVEMMLALEVKFNIKFDDIDTSNIRTVEDVVKCVESLK